MNDAWNSEALQRSDQPTPQFGLIDVVEAFTAFRHEYRTQVSETRDLAKRFDDLLNEWESRVATSRAVDSSQPEDKIVDALIEVDTQLSRVIEAVDSEMDLTHRLHQERYEHLQTAAAAMPRWRRRFAAPLLDALKQLGSEPTPKPSAGLDGLRIVATKVRAAMEQVGIGRIDTVGLPFDATRMRCVTAVDDPKHASEHVIEQILPGYVRGESVLRFAHVKIAR